MRKWVLYCKRKEMDQEKRNIILNISDPLRVAGVLIKDELLKRSNLLWPPRSYMIILIPRRYLEGGSVLSVISVLLVLSVL